MFTRVGSSGIVYDFEIYTGKGTVTDVYGFGLGGAVVLRILEIVPKGLNYKCFIDNWFTSLELLAELKSIGILTAGTIRSNRLRNCLVDSDKDMKKKGRGAHCVKYDSNQGLCVVKWFDSKQVLIASNYLCPEPVGQCQQWSKTEKEYVTASCPHVVEDYNKYMGGVDLSDMMMSMYGLTMRCKCWYLRLWYYCAELS